jgi:hypothetical protein
MFQQLIVVIYRMKKTFLFIAAVLFYINCFAQEQLAFPFQGGKNVMASFFKDSLVVSPEIIQKKASGTVIFKFTADEKGNISKIVIYYADDASLITPVIEALRKSNRKWIIPNREKSNDFLLPVTFGFNQPAVVDEELQKAVYDFNRSRRPIFATDQIPLNLATLLPNVVIKYDLPQ